MAGEGAEADRIKFLLDKYQLQSYFKLLGYKDNVPELLAIADIFILCSLYEGMSNALLEAMSMGLPVITTNVPGNIEITNDSALLFSPRDSKGLTRAIKSIIFDKNLKAELGIKSLDRIKDYDIQVTVNKWEEILKRFSHQPENLLS